MELQLTKQQAFELQGFLGQETKKFIDKIEIRKTSNVRRALQKVIQDYYNFHLDLQKENTKLNDVALETFEEWKGTAVDGKLPTDDEQKAQSQKVFNKLKRDCKVLQKQSEEKVQIEGDTKIAVTLDSNDWDGVQRFFERTGLQFQGWQDPEKYDQIAQLIETK